MDYKVFESMLNPIRMRIIQNMSAKETSTTKELAEICNDIPKATLYRHMNRLVEDGIIKIVSENKVRGTIEKVYSLRFNPYANLELNTKEIDKKTLEDMFFQFTVTLIRDFHNYLQRENFDFMNDGVGFRTYPVYLSNEEFEEFTVKFAMLLQKVVTNTPSPERKLRKLSTILVPYEDEII